MVVTVYSTGIQPHGVTLGGLQTFRVSQTPPPPPVGTDFLLLADGTSHLLYANATDALLLNPDPEGNILLADGSSNILLANTTDKLIRG